MTWRRYGRWEIVTLKTSSRRLGKKEMFAGKSFLLFTFQPKLTEWDYWKTFRLKILRTMRGISKMCSDIHTSSHRMCSVKNDVLKNFTGKHQSLFNKNNFNKKESNTGVFLWNLQHFKNIYFEEYMRMIPSECPWKVLWLKLKWEEGIRVGLKHMGGIICSVSLDVIRRTIRR